MDNMKFFLFLFLIGIGVGGFYLYKNGYFNKKQTVVPLVLQKEVKGIEISTNNSSTNSAVAGTINSIQDQAKNINLNQLASSSPQVRQIIQELQQLPQTPLNNAKNACLQICDKL